MALAHAAGDKEPWMVVGIVTARVCLAIDTPGLRPCVEYTQACRMP
eukprot:COSAG02_NODE_34724_length_479_cov_1.210526_1_plen_45_part_10